ncbi:hypothetical protein BGZ88_012688 [Linnemannia elongata]|nr:hypothetical protein BGZ88_012688 [Linnemannia elongata]
MVTATVTFVIDRPVKELQEQGTRVMFVGNHSGRITSLGNEEIVFHKDLDLGGGGNQVVQRVRFTRPFDRNMPRIGMWKE